MTTPDEPQASLGVLGLYSVLCSVIDGSPDYSGVHPSHPSFVEGSFGAAALELAHFSGSPLGAWIAAANAGQPAPFAALLIDAVTASATEGGTPEPLLDRLSEDVRECAEWLPAGLSLDFLAFMVSRGRYFGAGHCDHAMQFATRIRDRVENQARLIGLVGEAVGNRFDHSNELSDLNSAVELLRAAEEESNAGDPNRIDVSSLLSHYLGTRFDLDANLQDLDESIRLSRWVIERTALNSTNGAGRRINLIISLLARFDHTGSVEDLEAATVVAEALAAQLPHDHPDRASALNQLGPTSAARYTTFGALESLDSAIWAGTRAVAGAGSALMSTAARTNLANSLTARFLAVGDRSDLDEALRQLESARQAVRDPSEVPPALANSLGTAYGIRFDFYGNPDDHDASIGATILALELTSEAHPEHSVWLSNLATLVAKPLGRQPTRDQLDRAIELTQRATGRSLPASVLPGVADTAARLLANRFEIARDPRDLDDAIDGSLRAIEAVPRLSAEWSRIAANRASHLTLRFKAARDEADLIEARELLAEALASPASEASTRPKMLVGHIDALIWQLDPRSLEALSAAVADWAHLVRAGIGDIGGAFENGAWLVRILSSLAVHDVVGWDLVVAGSAALARASEQNGFNTGSAATVRSLLDGVASQTACALLELGRVADAIDLLEESSASLARLVVGRLDMSEALRAEPSLAARAIELQKAIEAAQDVSLTENPGLVGRVVSDH